MISKVDYRAFLPNQVFPPIIENSRIEGIQDNKRLLKKGYNSNYTVKIRVLGKEYTEVKRESNLYSLVIKRLLGITKFPKFKYKNVEIDEPAEFMNLIIENYYNMLSGGQSYLYVYKDSNGLIKINDINASNVFRSYKDGKFFEYVISRYVYKDEDIFREEEPVKVLLTHIGFIDKGQAYIREDLHQYYNSKSLLGPIVDSTPYFTNLTLPPLIEYRNGIHAESDFEQYKASIQDFETALTSLNLLIQQNLSPVIRVGIGSFFQEDPTTGEMLSTLKSGGVIESETPIDTVNLNLNYADLSKHKEDLFNDIAVNSELGPLLKAEFGGSNIAAESLEIMLISPLKKANRILKNIEEPMKKLMAVTLQLQGESQVKPDDIEVVYKEEVSKVEGV